MTYEDAFDFYQDIAGLECYFTGCKSGKVPLSAYEYYMELCRNAEGIEEEVWSDTPEEQYECVKKSIMNRMMAQ